jgi:hypothetical protein
MISLKTATWRWGLGTACLGLAAVVALGNNLLEGQSPNKPAVTDKPPAPPKNRELQMFMRQKLAAANQILEGLCTEDLGLVKRGAEKLHELSAVERWHVTNDVMYKQASDEYRQITQQLIQAADEGNIDRATLKWLDATVSCLDCHRFVRGIRIVTVKER